MLPSRPGTPTQTSVMAVLDQAGVPRHDADGHPLLQAQRVAALAAQRDALSSTGALPIPRERAPLPVDEVADVLEWGHADTGVRP